MTKLEVTDEQIASAVDQVLAREERRTANAWRSRRGHFSITDELLPESQPLFATCIPIRVEYRPDTMTLEVVAISEHFDRLKECEAVPTYVAEMERDEFKSWRRVGYDWTETSVRVQGSF